MLGLCSSCPSSTEILYDLKNERGVFDYGVSDIPTAMFPISSIISSDKEWTLTAFLLSQDDSFAVTDWYGVSLKSIVSVGGVAGSQLDAH